MASTEIVDIVDTENNVIGSIDVATAHEQKIIHRVVGVFVFNAQGDLYLQKGNKYGKLDLSVGGHVQKGESYEDAAKREMIEELGLTTSVQHITTFLPKNARLAHYWAIFITTAPADWNFQETEEVSSLEIISMVKIKEMLQKDPDSFTHGFKNTFQELIRLESL